MLSSSRCNNRAAKKHHRHRQPPTRPEPQNGQGHRRNRGPEHWYMHPIPMVMDLALVDEVKPQHVKIRQYRSDEGGHHQPPPRRCQAPQHIARRQMCSQHGKPQYQSSTAARPIGRAAPGRPPGRGLLPHPRPGAALKDKPALIYRSPAVGPHHRGSAALATSSRCRDTIARSSPAPLPP